MAAICLGLNVSVRRIMDLFVICCGLELIGLTHILQGYFNGTG